MPRYRVVTEWHVDAPVERVWDALLDYREWPEWWKGFRGVEPLEPGDDRGVGMRLRQHWRSLLPYTLVFELEIVGVEPLRLLEGRTTGDVAGTCRWTFAPDGDGSRVGFLLDVAPTRWWMRLPVPFAGRVFALNFDAVMRWGSVGLGQRLQALVVHRLLPLPA